MWLLLVFLRHHDLPKTPIVMTTHFIRKHIDIGIHDIMYQVSQQLVGIFKSMVHNEVQQNKEFEAK